MIGSIVARARPLIFTSKFKSKTVAQRCWVAAVAVLAVGISQPAAALVINPVFDGSITSLANASVVEDAFNSVAQNFSSQLDSDVQINVKVSWGSVGGQKLPGNAVGASTVALYGYFTYAQVKSFLTNASLGNPTNAVLATAVANLPVTTPAGVSKYVIPSSEAKVLGLIPPIQGSTDGSIGFAGNSVSGYTFDPTNGVRAGTYDFQAVATHELDEVLGRISGLYSTTPAYRTVFDLSRYKSPGVLSFTYSQAAYFSIDGGITNLGQFNNGSSGDRSDWLTLSGSTDIQDAFISTGKQKSLTAVDLTGLDALGYGGLNLGNTDWQFPKMVALNLAAVPEPGSLMLLTSMLGLLGVGRLRRLLKQ